MQESAFSGWRHALQELAATKEAAESWRHTRYQFAHKLGQALTGSGDSGEPTISGHVVYGVWLEWGLLYVGQTSKAERRLRDLPVGESHHLANTFPPEIWSRIVVISWPRLPEAEVPLQTLGVQEVGLGLEHRLQASLHPLVNATRRTSEGTWRNVDWSKSRSRGAVASGQLDELFAAVMNIWGETSNSLTCRVVHPADLLQLTTEPDATH
ncbi:hypothetical protein OG203_39920 [Nocardia sp. NBC_01499]|uniref:hypothetical protein n=1 Tax=Nocardia sp. NBC_01499 TaxID=2903597 RepID=UPI00386EADCA